MRLTLATDFGLLLEYHDMVAFGLESAGGDETSGAGANYAHRGGVGGNRTGGHRGELDLEDEDEGGGEKVEVEDCAGCYWTEHPHSRALLLLPLPAVYALSTLAAPILNSTCLPERRSRNRTAAAAAASARRWGACRSFYKLGR
jgi:hypothetical protein